MKHACDVVHSCEDLQELMNEIRELRQEINFLRSQIAAWEEAALEMKKLCAGKH